MINICLSFFGESSHSDLFNMLSSYFKSVSSSWEALKLLFNSDYLMFSNSNSLFAKSFRFVSWFGQCEVSILLVSLLALSTKFRLLVPPLLPDSKHGLGTSKLFSWFSWLKPKVSLSLSYNDYSYCFLLFGGDIYLKMSLSNRFVVLNSYGLSLSFKSTSGESIIEEPNNVIGGLILELISEMSSCL